MKNSLTIFILSAVLAYQSAAYTSEGQTFAPDNPSQWDDTLYKGIDGNGTVEWTVTKDSDAGTVTYTTVIRGNYEIELGEASITKDSSGALTVVTTGTGWSNDSGIGVTSNVNPFDVQEEHLGQRMAFYVGRRGYHSHPCAEYHVNMNRYRFDGQKHECTVFPLPNGAMEHPLDGTVLGTTHYSEAALDTGYTTGQNHQLTFGFTLQGDVDPVTQQFRGLRFSTPKTYVTPLDAIDTGEVNYGNNKVDTILAGTELALDAYIETQDEEDSNSFLLPNLGGTFSLTNLISYGMTIDANGNEVGVRGIPDDAWTYITIVKPLSEGNVPEPTTATLSLLALAGLAARRRRK